MTVLGVDVSFWNGNMNWQKCADAGAKFAFIRAGSVDNTSGKCYTDFKFERNSIIAPYIMPVGYYWYYRPNWSAVSQATYFAGLLDKAQWNLRPVIDVEAPSSTWNKNITARDYANGLAEFNYTLMTQLNLNKIIIYTRANYWNTTVEKRDGWTTHDLWIARYNTSLAHPWGDGKYVPRDWGNWKFWQWQISTKGYDFGTDTGSKEIDLDYFNGTQAEFEAYAGTINSPQVVWMQDIDKWARSQGYNGVTPFGD